MSVLCLDTATDQLVAALIRDDGTSTGKVAGARAQELLALVDEALGELDRSSLRAVVVGTGPGGFTGLRVGVATARGIAETLDVPLYGVSSLLAVAAEAALEHGRAWAAIAAGRGEAFVQQVVAEDGVPAAVGDAATVPAADVGALDGVVVDRPTASSLVRAANSVLPQHGDLAPGARLAVLPTYGRAPDATPPRIDVRVDELCDADLDQLVALERRCFPTPWSRELYAAELRRPPADAVRLAARDAGGGGRLVGAALAARIGDAWHVMNVLVDPTARGRGIARRLLDELLERSGALGVGEGWTLEVRDGNEAAIRLYERASFEHAGRRPGYYADTGEDALVMWRYASAGSEVAR